MIVGTWQTQEQSLFAPLAAFCEGPLCLFSNEHSNDAQLSSRFPLKQSASPQMNMETVKQITKSTPKVRKMDVDSLLSIVE